MSTHCEPELGIVGQVARYWLHPAGMPVISLILAGIIAVVYIVAKTAGWNESLIGTLGLHPQKAYSYLTYWAIHENTGHLLGNLLLLVGLGPSVERAAGRKPYVLMTFFLILAGSLASVTLAQHHWTEYQNPVGLSTMTYALMPAFAYTVTLNRIGSVKILAQNRAVIIAVAVSGSIAICTFLIWLFSSSEGGATLVGHRSALVGGTIASAIMGLARSQSQAETYQSVPSDSGRDFR